MVDSAVVKQNSLKCNLGSEAWLLESMLEVQVWKLVEASSQGLDQFRSSGGSIGGLEAGCVVLQVVGAGREDALQPCYAN